MHGQQNIKRNQAFLVSWFRKVIFIGQVTCCAVVLFVMSVKHCTSSTLFCGMEFGVVTVLDKWTQYQTNWSKIFTEISICLTCSMFHALVRYIKCINNQEMHFNFMIYLYLQYLHRRVSVSIRPSSAWCLWYKKTVVVKCVRVTP